MLMRKYSVLRGFSISFADLSIFTQTSTSSETDFKSLMSRITITVIKDEMSSVVSRSRAGACKTSCWGGIVFQGGGKEEGVRQ